MVWSLIKKNENLLLSILFIILSLDFSDISHFSLFFYLGFVSWTFMIHRTAGEGGDLFNSSLPLPPASQPLRHELCKLYFLHKRMPPCTRVQTDIFNELYLVAVVIKHKMDWKREMLLYGIKSVSVVNLWYILA